MIRALAFVLAVGLAASIGCRAPERPDPALDPHRTLAEVVALLVAHRDADVYRFDPPTDVTGENVFRTTLARLGRYAERLDDPEFRPAIRFAEAQARERLLDFEGAAAAYEEVARGGSDLAAEAGRLGVLPRALASVLRPIAPNARPDEVLIGLGERRAALRSRLASTPPEERRRCLVEAAVERLDVREREFLWRLRVLSPQGTQVALEAAEQLVADHPESRRLLAHTLRVADMVAELARAYVASVDPAGFDFDAAYARNLIQRAAQVYGEVAAIDGRPEREEARAQLLALEALTARIRGAR